MNENEILRIQEYVRYWLLEDDEITDQLMKIQKLLKLIGREYDDVFK